MDNQNTCISRAITGAIKLALADTRVVAVQGARQTGKSTLVKEFVTDATVKYASLDVTAVRESARSNPADFVSQMPDGLLVIDEIQRVPELLLEIKNVVDNSNRPGQFLITGSSDLSKLSGVQESLAGRLERVELMPFSQQELLGVSSSFLTDVFNADYKPAIRTASLTRSDYLELAIRGGYPEANQRHSKQRRDVWFDNYLQLLFEQEEADSKNGTNPEQARRFIRYLATIGGRELVIDSISNDINLKRYGVSQLLAYLEQLFLIEIVSPWSTSLTNRTIKHPKVFLKDSGLAARLLSANNSTASDLESSIAGTIFETFVFNELLRAASTLSTSLKFFHYRDTRKREVDIVIENDSEKLLLIEVKASSTVNVSDFRSINYLIETHPNRVARGIVIYTGTDVLPFGERTLAIPAQLLWS